jgi:hypothetical protein
MKASIPERRALVQRGLHKLSRWGVLKILRGVVVEQPDPAYLAVPKTYTAAFLPADTLRAFAADPANEMSAGFLDAALGKGDECYAILDGANLAAYGWYATTPTPVGAPGLQLHFRDDYVYMYKGFTDPRYRGQRLHAIGMTRALHEYRRRGLRGIVSYVESTNVDSLKSCFRMGYRAFGSIYLVHLLRRYFAFSSPGCEPFAFRIAIGQYTAPRAATGQSASTTPPRTQTYQS